MSKEVAEIGKKMQRKADTVFKQLKDWGEKFKRSWVDVGELVRTAREGHLWKLIGFERESELREETGIPKSSWYDYGRTAELLKDVPYEDKVQIKFENAKLLGKLDKDLRIAREWILKAKTLSSGEFELAVEKAIQQGGGDPLENDGDVRVWYKQRMKASQRELIEQTLTEYCKAYNLPEDDHAFALETICNTVRAKDFFLRDEVPEGEIEERLARAVAATVA